MGNDVDRDLFWDDDGEIYMLDLAGICAAYLTHNESRTRHVETLEPAEAKMELVSLLCVSLKAQGPTSRTDRYRFVHSIPILGWEVKVIVYLWLSKVILYLTWG